MTTPEDLKQRALGKVRRKAKRALQAHKKKGRDMKKKTFVFGCGCDVTLYQGGGASINQCPLHEAAPELLATGQALQERLQDSRMQANYEYYAPARECPEYKPFCAAIAKAKGGQG